MLFPSAIHMKPNETERNEFTKVNEQKKICEIKFIAIFE